MDLNKIKEGKKESARYMVEEITHVIKSFGKRDPGSVGEKEAIDYMAKTLEEYTDEVKVEDFEVHPGSFFGWIYFVITFVLAGFIMLFFLPIVSLFLFCLAGILLIWQFVCYGEILDKFFPKRTSYNITAVKKCTGEVKRRIFFNGHPDAVWEWPVNYRFGGKAFVAHAALCILGLLYVFCVSIAMLAISGADFRVLSVSDPVCIAALCGLVFLPFWVGLYFMWNERRVVDGANDNLTGCYMGISILKALKDNGVELENTEVGVIISGSEEAGVRGARAWSKKHEGEYDDVETLIYVYDTLHEGKFLTVNDRDLNLMVKADKRAADLFYNAAKGINITCHRGNVPLGATDSAAFNVHGFKAVGITAMNHDLQDYYHTRKDSYDNLDEECLADIFEVSVETLRLFDEGK